MGERWRIESEVVGDSGTARLCAVGHSVCLAWFSAAIGFPTFALFCSVSLGATYSSC